MSEIGVFDPSGQADGSLNALAGWEKHKTSIGANIEIASGLISWGGTGEASSQRTDTFTEDQYIDISLAGVKNGSQVGVFAGGQAPSAANNFYFGFLEFTAENTVTLRVASKISDTYDGFSAWTGTFHDDSFMRIVRVDDTIRFFVDGVLRGTYTCPTPASLAGGVPGILFDDASTAKISRAAYGNIDTATQTTTKTAEFDNQSSETNNLISPIDATQNSASFDVFTTSSTIVEWGIANLPPGLTCNSSTGEVTGTPADGSEGTYSCVLWAKDSDGWVAGENFDWTITTGASASPSLTVTQTELTPGGTFDFTYSNYETVPTTVTVSDGTNTITIPSPTINDNGDGSGSGSATMPSLPTSGTANLILFGNVTVELS